MKGLGLPSVLATLLYGQASAKPVEAKALQSRWAGSAGDIVKLFGDIFKTINKEWKKSDPAWDFGSNGYMCDFYMETNNGGTCYVTIECNDGKRKYNDGYAPWPSCFEKGRNFFSDPRIGNFSVEFQAQSKKKDWLDKPLIQIENLGGAGQWAPMDVEALAHENWEWQMCDASMTATDCTGYARICRDVMWDADKGPVRRWSCGVPKIGANFGNLQESSAPVNDRGYAAGECTVKATQGFVFLDNKPKKVLEAKVLDQNMAEIGNSGGQHSQPGLFFGSKLPLPFIVRWTENEENKNPKGPNILEFEYDAQVWNMNDQNFQCDVSEWRSKMHRGTYEGKPKIDWRRDTSCIFKCK